jgi:hypothetical protein
MNAVTIAPSPPRVALDRRPALDREYKAAARNPAQVAATEINRWITFLMFPFVLSAAFFAATITTGQLWLIGGALITGPGLLIMAFIYLGISSDTNGERG